MAIPAADPKALAAQARRTFLNVILYGAPSALQAVEDGAKALATQAAAPDLLMRRRDAWADLQRLRPTWLQHLSESTQRNQSGLQEGRFALPSPGTRAGELSLVDDVTIEQEILTSRLALAVMDEASSEFTDLRSRLTALERRDELPAGDLLRPHVMAREVLDAWRTAGLSIESWRCVQPVLHDEVSQLLVLAYHETNKWLIGNGVLPEIDLRPLIRRTVSSGGQGPGSSGATTAASTATGAGHSTMAGGMHGHRSDIPEPSSPAAVALAGGAATGPVSGGAARHSVGEETRLMTRASSLLRASEQAQAVLGRLNRLVGRQVPDFEATTNYVPSPKLVTAIAEAERDVTQRLRTTAREAAITPGALSEELNERKRALKRATDSPIERATIEIVALLFQSILTEERLPATVRVWFARLQMPVLRVAVSEPDFFATTDHPARKLIDRMGACVMGFDSATAGAMGDALEKEIKRVVQVVEAYPDTGRRVFQTVLVEFEKFLEHYFRTENEISRKGVSLAQQVEQREILAIQYTIELRKMLNEVPVQEGVREFLFQIWADVLAMTAVKSGAQAEPIKVMKRAAADLIWSASAKVSREERAEVIRRLPPLLKILRDGMATAGVSNERQDEHIQTLNNSLAAAFTAKTAAIPSERLNELMLQLETLEEMLPDTEVEIDESLVLDLSGHESSGLEVVAEGGSMPSPAMVAWARGIQMGSWFKLDYRGRNEPVQLAWQGLRKQLSLFASPNGRCVLFQQHRLAAFLQAGLMVPAEEEALTVRATRDALAKLGADPSRLLN